uniref:Dynein light chain roadblock-type 2 n=1 Tax=Paramormyrops kingsleyae TaxID=1676925 RepID=A0A3B3R4T4_9TELE
TLYIFSKLFGTVVKISKAREWIARETEVEETLKRIESRKGVIGTIVVNAEGIPIRTTLDNSTTVQYVGLLHHLAMKARNTVRELDPQNDLTFLRVRSRKHEIMVAPDKDYLLIVIQSSGD